MSRFKKQTGFAKTVTIRLHGLKTYYLKVSEFLNATLRYGKTEWFELCADNLTAI